MKVRYTLGIVLLSACACGLTGCSSKPPALVPAVGTVSKADGTPLVGANVTFWPQKNQDSVKSIPFSLTDMKGGFQILTSPESGLMPGKYKVTVTEIPADKSDTVPPKYRLSDSTPWEVTIPKSGKTDIRLQIARE